MIVFFLLIYGLGIVAIMASWFLVVLPALNSAVSVFGSLAFCFFVAAAWALLLAFVFDRVTGQDSDPDQK